MKPFDAEIRHVRDATDVLEQLSFAVAFEIFFQLERAVEMVFDRPFSAARDDDDVLDARGDGFFDRVLDQRFVHQREHLFGRGFGGRKKAGSQAGGGDDGFPDGGRRHALDTMGTLQRKSRKREGLNGTVSLW